MNIDAVPFASNHAHHPQVGILSAEDLQPSEDADPPLELGITSQLQERFIWPRVFPGL